MDTDFTEVPEELMKKVPVEAWREFVLWEVEESELFKGKLVRWLYRNYDEPEATEQTFVDRVQLLFYYCLDESSIHLRLTCDETPLLCWSMVGEEMEALVEVMRRLPKKGRAKVVKAAVIEFFLKVTEYADFEFMYYDYTLLKPAFDACADVLVDWIALSEVSPDDRRDLLMREMPYVCSRYLYSKKKIYDMEALKTRLITAAGLSAERS